MVLPVSERFNEAAAAAGAKLKEAGLRIEVDDKNEKLGARIRRAEMQKTPAMLVIGEKEAAAGTVAVRLRHGGDAGTLPVEEFLSLAARAIVERRSELTMEVKNR